MKTILKFFSVASLITALIVGCQEDKGLKPLTKLEQRKNMVLASPQFTNLNISTQDLDEPTFVNSDEKHVAFTIKGSNSKKAVIALFNESSDIQGVFYFEVDSPIPSSEMEDAMIRKDYTGTFLMKTINGAEEIAVAKSKIVRRTITSGRELACAGATEPGGALWCFGERLEAMNWLDSALCYVEFMICYLAGIASCYIDGCVAFPN